MTPVSFLMAYVTDIIVGDPRWFPHPVVIMGKMIGFLEDKIRRGFLFVDEKRGGIILWFAVTGSVYLAALGIAEVSFIIHPSLGFVVTVILASLTLATRSLFSESKGVLDALNDGDMAEARRRLSMIVGRDTEKLDEQEIYRAVVETVSENLSDGIIAPMLYLAIGGVPLAMAYKAVNTLDSMVGYKNERYRDLGWFSARMDDLWNWVPARLTGIVIVIVSVVMRLGWRDSWRIMVRDGGNHSSPNSGVPEAAMAGSLGIQLGGKIQYFGELSYKPTIGDRHKEMDQGDVVKAWAVMFLSSFLSALLCLIIVGIMQ